MILDVRNHKQTKILEENRIIILKTYKTGPKVSTYAIPHDHTWSIDKIINNRNVKQTHFTPKHFFSILIFCCKRNPPFVNCITYERGEFPFVKMIGLLPLYTIQYSIHIEFNSK